MGKRDRERIERIIRGEEQPISAREEKIKQVAETIKNRLEKKVTKKFSKMDLVQQVKQANKLIRMAGVIKFRATFLQPDSFPKDLQDKRDSGMTNELIIDYYWNCLEFVEFWTKLNLSKQDFLGLVKPL